MKDVPVVKVGQVWADNDKRALKNRRLRVVECGRRWAMCEVFYEHSLMPPDRTVRVLIRRFRPTSTGYRLVSE